MFSGLGKEFTHVLPAELITENAPMSGQTTFRIGGPADVLLQPNSVEQVIDCISIVRKKGIPLFLMGNGSNLLVSDAGIRGAVLKIGSGLDAIEMDETSITAQAGATLAQTSRTAARAGLLGLEFAAGIPGTVGGGLYMNAGAYGGELSDVIVSAQVLDTELQLRTLQREDMQLSYRHSIFQGETYVVLSAQFLLQAGESRVALDKIEELAAKRRDKQPLSQPSAGSAFRRPVGGYAAQLIEQAGLKGFQIGGAAVSEKHAGFIVNLGGATAADVRALIAEIAERVQKMSGVLLVPEIKMTGEF